MTRQEAPIWAPGLPFPAADAMPFVADVRSQVVQGPDADYRFLHDCVLAAAEGVIHCAWYNCPEKEMQEASVIRGRRSLDSGRTWSAIELLSSDPSGRLLHVPPVLHAQRGQVLAWVLQMSAIDVPEALLAYELGPDGWQCLGPVGQGFLPNCAPVSLPDGSHVMAGRMALTSGEPALHPAIARCRDPLLRGAWEATPLVPGGEAFGCPETTVWAEGEALTAIVRPGVWVKGDPGRMALVSQSIDLGRTWSVPRPSNFPMQPSKAHAGTSSTGQRYLLSNSPGRGGFGRELLTIAVSRPGERTLSRIWRVQDGDNAALGCGPEWSYPCAVEADGELLLVYSSAKRRCVFSALPVTSLAC